MACGSNLDIPSSRVWPRTPTYDSQEEEAEAMLGCCSRVGGGQNGGLPYAWDTWPLIFFFFNRSITLVASPAGPVPRINGGCATRRAGAASGARPRRFLRRVLRKHVLGGCKRRCVVGVHVPAWEI
jgi:hypothetical protein